MGESMFASDVIMITKVTIYKLTINAGIVIVLTITPIGVFYNLFNSVMSVINDKGIRSISSLKSVATLV